MIRTKSVFALKLSLFVAMTTVIVGADAYAQEAADKPKRGPKFFNLRQNEDFSYLDGDPDSYTADFWDPIKNIHLSDDWRLSIGGEFRYQLIAESNISYGARARTQDTFNLFRFMLHFDLKYKNVFRIFAQGVHAFDEDRDLAPRGIDENRWDLQQLFFDVMILGEDVPLTLRVGRQDLQYGKQRFISPLDWANVRRRFDGVKLFWKTKNWDADFWYVKPTIVERREGDDFNRNYDFYGFYATYKAIPRHAIDFFLFATDNVGNAVNPNGKAGDVTRFTAGTRFYGKAAGFDYDAMLAGQWGRWAGDTIQAWAWSLYGGYTFEEVKCKPRVGFGVDWASGDEDPRDGKVGTFDQLFPLGHAWLGYLDLIARQNVTALHINASAWAVPKKVKCTIAWHTFWKDAERDAIYNSGGRVTVRDPLGRNGTDIGQELDLTVNWKISRHSDCLFGYSRFWGGNAIIGTGNSDNPELIYFQYRYKF